MAEQPGSQFWGTGSELTGVRDHLNPQDMHKLLIRLGNRFFGKRFDYTVVEWRGWNLPVTLIVTATKERISITPHEHLMSGDGYGNRV